MKRRDSITLLLRQLLKPLMTYNPLATAVGGFIGLFTYQLMLIAQEAEMIPVSPGPMYVWLLAGAALFNIRSAVRTIKLPDEVEVALLVIRQAKSDGVGQAHISTMYRQLFDRVSQDLSRKAPVHVQLPDRPASA